jgi:hypothetical protein
MVHFNMLFYLLAYQYYYDNNYNRTTNPKIKELAKEIIDTQEKEIQLMKSML